MNYFKTRKIRKNASELLGQASHLRNYREDVMRQIDLQKLSESEDTLKNAIKSGNAATIENASESLLACMSKVAPAGRRSGLAENFEILVVAIIVAMGFRTYFIQPFKIPTGSMEPTLNGIHTEARAEPRFMDRIPMKYFKWIVYGEWFLEVKVKEDGYLTRAETSRDETSVYWYVGNKRYKVPRNIQRLNCSSGDHLKKGDILWSGTVITGDHVFVDKIRWNFAKPKRGQVMVFSTQDIKTLPPGTHYIKRLIGLPGETLSVVPPNVIINGKAIEEPLGITRIQRQEAGYPAGYVLPYSFGDDCYISSSNDVRKLGSSEYFVLGDNTRNSRDGRYWGTVPEKNTIGPAFLVYWPYSARWGRIR
ncbi:MAG: signal peptidase I [Kiritimatiellae bacterium]|nr:signal peptidase I [Kiritimatiellia bacterium]MDD5521259.1 signal peptidase I [Kiritimatiellia bacterium]